jgi:hypothetical protein
MSNVSLETDAGHCWLLLVFLFREAAAWVLGTKTVLGESHCLRTSKTS